MTTHPSTLFKQGYEAAQRDMNRTIPTYASREAKLCDMINLLLGALQHPSIQCVSDKHLEHVRRLMGEASDLISQRTP